MTEHQQIFDTLLNIRRLYVEEMNNLLNSYHLSSAQWLIFKSVAQNAPTTLVEVAKDRTIEKPTATKVIHKLIELNLIMTTEGKDKREKILTLTHEGKTHFEIIYDAVSNKQKQLLETVEQLDTLSSQLELISTQLQLRKDERNGRIS